MIEFRDLWRDPITAGIRSVWWRIVLAYGACVWGVVIAGISSAPLPMLLDVSLRDILSLIPRLLFTAVPTVTAIAVFTGWGIPLVAACAFVYIRFLYSETRGPELLGFLTLAYAVVPAGLIGHDVGLLLAVVLSLVSYALLRFGPYVWYVLRNRAAVPDRTGDEEPPAAEPRSDRRDTREP